MVPTVKDTPRQEKNKLDRIEAATKCAVARCQTKESLGVFLRANYHRSFCDTEFPCDIKGRNWGVLKRSSTDGLSL